MELAGAKKEGIKKTKAKTRNLQKFMARTPIVTFLVLAA
jgi:hypothetical protein